MLQFGIRASLLKTRCLGSVSSIVLLLVGYVTIWYQRQGFNTEPGWAMLVEVEEKVSEEDCCQNGKNSSLEPWVQALSLDGLDKWS
jgi:hypothetical protein